METIIVKLDKNCIDKEKLLIAGDILKKGGLVAFPTETVYGLGGDALNPEASAKIYAAKGRPSDNPLIVHVADMEDVSKIAAEVGDNAKALMEKYWPGPLTLIFKKKGIVPDATTGGLDTVAVRMPVHEIARELIRESKVLIAAPSANISGRPSPTTGAHVIEDMDGRIDMIIDGGECNIGLESTIIDVTGEIPMVLRPGYVTEDMVKEVCGDVEIDPAILKKPDANMVAKAPGMKYKHYAPKADLTLFEGEMEKVVSIICKEARKSVNKGLSVGIIGTDESVKLYEDNLKDLDFIKSLKILSIGKRSDIDSVAHNLFAILRKFDELGTDVILGETFADVGFGRAITNRLSKASGYHIESV